MKVENRKTWMSVFVLITIEQVIKIIINYNFLDKRYPILPPLLYFKPMFNRHYSWFNSMLQLGVGKWAHIAITAAMGILVYLLYRYFNRQLGPDKTINALFAFIFSGAMCSLIDKVFWNGSLDYILLNGFFTFDLKDVYIDIFIGLLILSLLLGNKTLKQINNLNVTKDFAEYIRQKLKN